MITGSKVIPKILAKSKVSGLAFSDNKKVNPRINNLVMNKWGCFFSAKILYVNGRKRNEKIQSQEEGFTELKRKNPNGILTTSQEIIIGKQINLEVSKTKISIEIDEKIEFASLI